VSAQELYSRVVHEPVPANASAAFTNAVEEAQRELAALAPRVPGVVIKIVGPEGTKVTLDETEVPSAAFGVKRPADPGKHVIRALAPGHSPAEKTVTLVEGGTETVTLELKPGPGGPPVPVAPPPLTAPVATVAPLAPAAPPAPPGPLRNIGFAAIGVGGAGLLVGAIAGGIALSKHGDLASQCPGGHCPQSKEGTLQSEVSSYTAAGTASTVGFVAGGVLAVTGVILVAAAPKPAQRAGVGLVVGPGYAGVAGKF